jgi:hypothetical protein
MAVEQQNALVQKYCAVCHNDAMKSGGLSLDRFDAERVPPSLAAMLVSKLTSGISLQVARAAASDAEAADAVAKSMKGGAINAAGKAVPDDATLRALITALASEATDATTWSMSRAQDPATNAPMVTASLLREAPRSATGSEMYRLVLACNTATREGSMQLTWAPVPKNGTVTVTVDDAAQSTYKAEGAGQMTAGAQSGAASASVNLAVNLPALSLTVSDLFPNEMVEFPFDALTPVARQSLAPCFVGK